jgi:hypothetical protein
MKFILVKGFINICVEPLPIKGFTGMYHIFYKAGIFLYFSTNNAHRPGTQVEGIKMFIGWRCNFIFSIQDKPDSDRFVLCRDKYQP